MTIYQTAGCGMPGTSGWKRNANPGSLPSRTHSLRGHHGVSEVKGTQEQGGGALRIQGRLSRALNLQEESKATLGQEHGFEESRLQSHRPKTPGLGVHETREGATDQRDAKGPEGTP